jgi:hypothetical protein
MIFAARARVGPARRRAVAARAAAASKVALARNRCVMPGVGFAANEGNAAREAAFRIEPRAPASPRSAPRGRTR